MKGSLGDAPRSARIWVSPYAEATLARYSALRLMVDVLTQLGQGRAVTVLPQNAELTTQEVADYLNVSRPYVVGLIERNLLPARKVGTRRRVAFEDLVRYDEQQRAQRRAALDELARIDQELGL